LTPAPGADGEPFGPFDSFDPRALERRFEPLEVLGRRLWLPAIVNTQGRPVPRLAALAVGRARLLAGRSPFEPGDAWPDGDVAAAFGAACHQLALGEVARGHEEVTEQVLRSLLWHLDRIAGRAAHAGRAAAIAESARAFHDDWETQREELREVLRIFDSLDGVANFARWTEIRGLLRSEPWLQVLAARERIAQMPKLSALIRRLGRLRPADDLQPRETSVADATERTLQWVRRPREVELPGVPLETEGIRRSGDFDRLLASEIVLLRRRRRLLAARLAEQTLLTYQHRQFWLEAAWVQEEGAPRARRPQPRPELVAGPMIVCVDTSASMAGAPEAVAKAVVLEAMRVAAAERRECLLFAFSGPGDLCELRLGRDVDGLHALAEFLWRSFHGGTDVCEPFERALGAVETRQWRQADLLIASDGEFGAPAALAARLREARDRLGLRVQGILIGDRETIGLREICSDIFWVRDWRRYAPREAPPGSAQVDSPVHSRRLTALYFPGAFVGRGAASDVGDDA